MYSEEEFYMFSEEHGLMCGVSGDSYWVYNGRWEGTRKGDEFTVEMTGKVLNITDWKRVYRRDLSEDDKINWYIPTDKEEEVERINKDNDEFNASMVGEGIAF